MRRLVLLTALLAMLPDVVMSGIAPTGIGSFAKLIPGTDKQVAITSALLTDTVFYRISLIAGDGEHLLRVNVYDGSGREVFNAESSVIVKDRHAGRSLSYGFSATRDAPGTWWYVAALDGKVVISNSLEVRK